MSRPHHLFEILTWTPTPGCGVQIGELTVQVVRLPRGLVICRINTFCLPGRRPTFGPPLVPIGEHAGRYSGFEFPDPADRKRAFDDLRAVLLAAHPELAGDAP